MLASDMTLAECPAIHDRYDARVRPWIEQLLQTSGQMDAFMGSHQGDWTALLAYLKSLP